MFNLIVQEKYSKEKMFTTISSILSSFLSLEHLMINKTNIVIVPHVGLAVGRLGPGLRRGSKRRKLKKPTVTARTVLLQISSTF